MHQTSTRESQMKRIFLISLFLLSCRTPANAPIPKEKTEQGTPPSEVSNPISEGTVTGSETKLEPRDTGLTTASHVGDEKTNDDQGGISGGGQSQLRPCFFEEPFEFVGLSYVGSGLKISFHPDGTATLVENGVSSEYLYSASAISCIIEIKKSDNKNQIRKFLIAMDYQSLSDWDNASIVLKVSEP